MKKISIETAALKALGASAKALQYYHDTDPIDIYQLEDGSYEVTGAIPFYAETVCDLLRELDALADEFGYEGANSAFDAHQAAPALYDGGWRPADADQLKAEYDLTDEETAALVAELEEIEPEPKTYRDLAEEDESMNLSWCKPYVSADGNHKLIMHDGEVESISSPTVEAHRWDGSLTDEVMAAFAKEVNPEYDEYQGWTDAHIALDAMHETGCWHCPFRDECEAMGEQVNA